MHKRGFTLIELLVVIAIIGVLSAVVLASLNSARDKAKVAKAVAEVRQFNTVVTRYFTDTGRLPSSCDLDCTSANDPYKNALGVAGWSGPYFPDLHAFAHPWGGHFSIRTADLTADGRPDLHFILDDDAPGDTADRNAGRIPTAQLQAIDRIIDDGNLSTGNARGDAQGYLSAPGELVYIPAL